MHVCSWRYLLVILDREERTEMRQLEINKSTHTVIWMHSSVATEWVKGKTADECKELTNADIANELNLPPVKLHCR